MTWSKAPFLIVIAACLWGTTGTAQAFAPDAASSVSIGAARLIVGGLVLVVVASTRGPRRAGLLRRPDVVVAAVGMAAYQPLFFSAVSRTGVAVGTVIALGSAPIMTGLLSTVSGEDRPNGGWARATAFALTGIVILVLSSNSDPTLDVGGGLMALGAGGSYAAYATATRRASQDVEFRSLAGAVFLLAGIASLPVLLATDLSWLRSGRGAGVALWLGIGATAIAYLLFGRGIERVHAPSATTLTLAEPVTATLLAVVVLSEQPTLASWLGVGLVIVGLVLATVNHGRSRAPQDEIRDVGRERTQD